MNAKNITLSLLALCLSSAICLAETEKHAFLGVVTYPVDEVTMSHLGINHGLVIKAIDANSPASTALQQNDILLKLNDQLLMNPSQLASLIKTHNIGDTVQASYLRAGEEGSAEVKLAEKKAQTANKALQKSANAALANSEILRNEFQILNSSTLDSINDLQISVDGQEINIGEVVDLSSILGGLADANGSVMTSINTVASSISVDGDTTYQITSQEGKTSVKIKEGGKLVFEGPYHTDEDKATVPKKYRKHLDDLSSKTSSVVITHPSEEAN